MHVRTELFSAVTSSIVDKAMFSFVAVRPPAFALTLRQYTLHGKGQQVEADEAADAQPSSHLHNLLRSWEHTSLELLTKFLVTVLKAQLL